MAVVLGTQAGSSSVPLSKLERGSWLVQVAFNRNLGGRAIGGSPGNLHGPGQLGQFGRHTRWLTRLAASWRVPELGFRETTYAKQVPVPQALLSTFYYRPYQLATAVSLPSTRARNTVELAGRLARGQHPLRARVG